MEAMTSPVMDMVLFGKLTIVQVDVDIGMILGQ